MVLPWTWFRLHLDQLARDKRTQGHGHRDSRTGKTGNRSSGRRRLRFREIVVANAALTALCRCFCTLHITEIPRTDPLVQVGYVRVVDLDIGASKSGFGEGRAVADLDDFNGSAQITNLGGRRSNLFGRAIFPPFSTKPRTIAEFPYGSVPI